MASTITVQKVVNFALTHIELMPITNIGGIDPNEPALSLANDVLSELMMGTPRNERINSPFPWKFNRKYSNLFVASYSKNDYLWAGASAFTITGSFAAAAIDLASNSAVSAGVSSVTVNTLEPHNFQVGDTVYLTGLVVKGGNGANAAKYNAVFTNTNNTGAPISSTWSGGFVITAVTSTSFTFALGAGQVNGDILGAAGITDMGWLESATYVQMTDVSLPQMVRYCEGVRHLQPFSRLGAFPDRICVLQDLGTGVIKLRLQPLPGNTPLGFTLEYQAQAPLLTALTQTWAPFPDNFNALIRQCFLARCYRYLESKRADVETKKADDAVLAARGMDDAENSEESIVPDNPILASTGDGGMRWL